MLGDSATHRRKGTDGGRGKAEERDKGRSVRMGMREDGNRG